MHWSRGNTPPSPLSDSRFSAEFFYFDIFYKICERPVDILLMVLLLLQMKFSPKNFFSKCDQICITEEILKKNFIFCAVLVHSNSSSANMFSFQISYHFPLSHRRVKYFLFLNSSDLEFVLWSITLREKCPYSEFSWSVFSRIYTEYGPEKLWMGKHFTQCQ